MTKKARRAVHKTLVALRELLSEPERWTQGALAQSSSGVRCDPLDPFAVSWCLMGGLARIAGTNVSPDIALTEMELLRLINRDEAEDFFIYDFLHLWNDEKGRKHSHVLALLDRGISECEE